MLVNRLESSLRMESHVPFVLYIQSVGFQQGKYLRKIRPIDWFLLNHFTNKIGQQWAILLFEFCLQIIYLLSVEFKSWQVIQPLDIAFGSTLKCRNARTEYFRLAIVNIDGKSVVLWQFHKFFGSYIRENKYKDMPFLRSDKPWKDRYFRQEQKPSRISWLRPSHSWGYFWVGYHRFCQHWARRPCQRRPEHWGGRWSIFPWSRGH